MEVEEPQKTVQQLDKRTSAGLNLRRQNYVRLEQGNSSARCCLQTADTQIICTAIGPFHAPKVTQQDCEIKGVINYLHKSPTAEAESDIVLRRELLDLLSEIVDVKKYPKSTLSLTFDVISANGPLFPFLVNIACFTLCLAGIQISDMFASVAAGFLGNNLVIDPTDKEFTSMSKRLCLVQLKNSQRIVYLDMQGSLDFEEIQKLLSVGVSGCGRVSSFQGQLLGEYSSK